MRKALAPWDQLSGQSREVLVNSPLVLTIGRVNFNEKLKATTDEVAGAFQDRIETHYPALKTVNLQTMEFSGAIGHAPSSRALPPQRTLQFSDQTENWIVSLNNDSISLESRAYQSFDDFTDRLRDVLIACVETVRPTLVHRIGLRYIDEIRLSSAQDASSLITPKLLGPLTETPFLASVENAVHSFELQAGEHARINFKHGLLSAGTTVQPRLNEEQPQGPFYLLDLDVYQMFEGNHAIAMHPENIVTRFEEFHDTLSKIFWWSVTEDFMLRTKGVDQ